SRLDLAETDRRPIAGRYENRSHRGQSADKDGLPLHGLGGRFAIAPAILDRKTPAMREPAPQRDIHDLGPRALQQFAPGAFEIDLAEHGARSLAQKAEKLPLQRPAEN